MSPERQQNLESKAAHQPVTESAKAVNSTIGSQSADEIGETQPQQLVADKKATYAEKTNRIQALNEKKKTEAPKERKAENNIVIVPLLGRGFIAGSLPKHS